MLTLALMLCIISVLTGVLIYDKSTWFDSQPNIVPDNGDGTVNVRSLRACLNWQKQQKQPVFHKEFPNVDHMSLLKDAGVIQYLKQVLVGSWWRFRRFTVHLIYKSFLSSRGILLECILYGLKSNKTFVSLHYWVIRELI